MGIKRIVIAGNRTEKETSLRNRYCQTVFQVGGLPVLVSVENAAEAQAYAEAFDALLLPGGNDLPGVLFGQAQHPVAECDSPLHDQSDRLLWEAFHASGKRVLGICRGMQAVNVFCGGTLFQHLPDVFDPVLWHAGNIYGRHDVFVQEDSMLAQVFGGGERRCNSSHHQAVDRLGKALHAVAFAPDGVMEAAEGENTLLVQFHPEAMGEEGAGVLKWLLQ